MGAELAGCPRDLRPVTKAKYQHMLDRHSIPFSSGPFEQRHSVCRASRPSSRTARAYPCTAARRRSDAAQTDRTENGIDVPVEHVLVLCFGDWPKIGAGISQLCGHSPNVTLPALGSIHAPRCKSVSIDAR